MLVCDASCLQIQRKQCEAICTSAASGSVPRLAATVRIVVVVCDAIWLLMQSSYCDKRCPAPRPVPSSVSSSVAVDARTVCMQKMQETQWDLTYDSDSREGKQCSCAAYCQWVLTQDQGKLQWPCRWPVVPCI